MRGEAMRPGPGEAADVVSDSVSSATSGTSMVVPRGQPRLVVGLGLAFFCLGFALGELTGFSTAQGISQALLTAVFSFVGGVLLSYAGFRRVAEDGRLRLDPQRVSTGVVGLSLGLCIGLPSGVYTRCNRDVQSFFLGERLEHSQCITAGPPAPTGVPATTHVGTGIGLQSGQRSVCIKAIQALNLAFDEPKRDAAQLRALASSMVKACDLGGP